MNSIKRIRFGMHVAVLGMWCLAWFCAGSASAQKAPEYSNNFLMDNKTIVFGMVDRLEYYHVPGGPLVLDAQGFIGKDLRRLWIEAEGEARTAHREGEMEVKALYGRAISAFFDARAGLRYDVAYSGEGQRRRGLAVIGIQGLAPYLFELDANVFLSQHGNVSAAIEAEYGFPITQRLWGQPRMAARIAAQEVEEWGVGTGINDLELGFRLRYEIRREFAPYIGVAWNQRFGATADMIEDEGGQRGTFGLVGGLRMWF